MATDRASSDKKSMAKQKTVLGVEVVGDTLRLAVTDLGETGLTLRGTAVVRPGDEVAKVLREMHARPQAVVAAVSLEHSAVRILDLPPSTEENLERVMALEAETALPLPPEELALAHHMLGLTEQSRLEVLLAAARQSAVQDAMRRVSGGPNTSTQVTVTPVALMNALERLRPTREAVCAVLRVEETSTELLVLDRKKLLATQSFPHGFGKGIGAGGEDGPTWLSELSQQVRYALRSLSYERGMGAERLYVCGGGATQPGMEARLAEVLGIPVTVLTPQEGDVAGSVYAVAYGCAVQAAELAAIPLNLTPARMAAAMEVAQRRQAKVSWVALAIAGVTAALLIFAAAVHNKQQELEQVQARLRDLGPGVVVASAPATKELTAGAEAVEAALQTRVTAADALSLLNRRMPVGTWLAEVSYNAETGCVVRGYSKTPDGPQQAHMAILGEDRFDTVTFDYRTKDVLGDKPVWGFQITCRLQPPDRRTTTRRAPAGAKR